MVEADADAYFTISIWFSVNSSSSRIVLNGHAWYLLRLRHRHRHIRARVWIMIISIILYRLVLYYVLSVLCVFNLGSMLSNSHFTCPVPHHTTPHNLLQLLIEIFLFHYLFLSLCVQIHFSFGFFLFLAHTNTLFCSTMRVVRFPLIVPVVCVFVRLFPFLFYFYVCFYVCLYIFIFFCIFISA